MLWEYTCCGNVHAVGMYMLWECTCCGNIHAVGIYMLWECTCCGNIHAVDIIFGRLLNEDIWQTLLC